MNSRRNTWRLIRTSCLALAFAGVRTTAFAGSDAASSSSVQTLLNAPTPIDKTDVTNLRLAWSTNIPDGRQHTASTIIRNGTMYLSAPHEGVLAPNAGDRKVHRQTPHNPKYVLLYVVNRNVQGCRDTSNSLYSMVALYTDSLVGFGHLCLYTKDQVVLQDPPERLER